MTIDSILPIPDIFAAKRILCIQPHYDDNDIGAGGTLKQLKDGGADLFYLTVTDDLMGVIDDTLTSEEAAAALRANQVAAGKIIGVCEQYWLGFPDAGAYDYFEVRRDMLKIIRMVKPDLIFTPDPWLTYEGHRDHVQTGLAATEGVMFSGLTRIASSDPTVDAAYNRHEIQGVVYYFTREPNLVIDLEKSWDEKLAAVCCYTAQFDPEGMEQLVLGLDLKSRQVALDQPYERGEALKVLHPSSLHCGF